MLVEFVVQNPHCRSNVTDLPIFSIFFLNRLQSVWSLMNSSPLSKSEVELFLKRLDTKLTREQERLLGLYVQQPMNCCSMSTVATVLSTLGFETSIDDIVNCSLNVETILTDGLTLADVFDVTLRYICKQGLSVAIQCVHFDRWSVSLEQFRVALEQIEAGKLKEIMAINFHSGIAHGLEYSDGGGHFSIIIGFDKNRDEVIIFDVNPFRYYRFWSVQVTQMFQAISDFDSCRRARGVLLFMDTARLELSHSFCLRSTVCNWKSPPSNINSANLQKMIFNDKAFIKHSNNLECFCAISTSLEHFSIVDTDISVSGLVRACNESFTFHLQNFADMYKVTIMFNHFCRKRYVPITARVEVLEAFCCNSLRSILRKERSLSSLILLCHNINETFGQEIVPPDTCKPVTLRRELIWSIVAGYDITNSAIVLLPTYNSSIIGRFITCSLNQVVNGMRGAGKNIRNNGVIVISKH